MHGGGEVVHGGGEVVTGGGEVAHGGGEVVHGGGEVVHGGGEVVHGGGVVEHGGGDTQTGGDGGVVLHGGGDTQTGGDGGGGGGLTGGGGDVGGDGTMITGASRLSRNSTTGRKLLYENIGQPLDGGSWTATQGVTDHHRGGRWLAWAIAAVYVPLVKPRKQESCDLDYNVRLSWNFRFPNFWSASGIAIGTKNHSTQSELAEVFPGMPPQEFDKKA